jgi:hypothetical protein
MTAQQARPTLRRWLPRALGILITLFIASFSLDAIHDGPVALMMHLAPAMLLALIVAASWEHEWIAGGLFLIAAAAYAARSLSHPSWIIAIALPLATVGLAYLASWAASRRPR